MTLLCLLLAVIFNTFNRLAKNIQLPQAKLQAALLSDYAFLLAKSDTNWGERFTEICKTEMRIKEISQSEPSIEKRMQIMEGKVDKLTELMEKLVSKNEIN